MHCALFSSPGMPWIMIDCNNFSNSERIDQSSRLQHVFSLWWQIFETSGLSVLPQFSLNFSPGGLSSVKPLEPTTPQQRGRWQEEKLFETKCGANEGCAAGDKIASACPNEGGHSAVVCSAVEPESTHPSRTIFTVEHAPWFRRRWARQACSAAGPRRWPVTGGARPTVKALVKRERKRLQGTKVKQERRRELRGRNPSFL